MKHPRRYVAVLLIAGLVLAVGTPLQVARATPHLTAYLMHPVILLLQTIPYVVCAAIWLPWSGRSAALSALALASLLFLAALVIYLPALLAPGKRGGDMIGLWYVLTSVTLTAGVLAGSALAGLILWLRVRARQREPS